jgi:hypothetical protein
MPQPKQAEEFVVTPLEQVLYTVKTHTTDGREGGASRTSDGHLDVKVSIPGTHGSLRRWPGDICEQSKVADAAAELPQTVFGNETSSDRLRSGVACLPLGIPFELEVVFGVIGRRCGGQWCAHLASNCPC